MNENELLSFALENGIISIDEIKKKYDMNERKRFLEEHKGKIWETNGVYQTYVSDKDTKRGKRLIRRKDLSMLEDEIVKHYKKESDDPYIQRIFDEWIDEKIAYGEISKSSFDRYTADFKRFFESSELYNIRFRYITENMLEDFIKTTIHEQELTAKAWGGLRILINGIFRYGKKHKYTDISITEFMGDLWLSNRAFTRPKKKKINKLVFTDNEVQMLISAIMEKEQEPTIIELGILLAFYTGLRPGELATLKWQDIHSDFINIERHEVRYLVDGKYNWDIVECAKTEAGEREVVLTNEAKKLLYMIRRKNPFGEYIFLKADKRIKGQAFTKRLYVLCDKLCIERKSLNKCRKTYASKLIISDMDDKQIINQMGHTNIDTTRDFYFYDSRGIKELQKQLNHAVVY